MDADSTEALRNAQAALARVNEHDHPLHEALRKATSIRHSLSGLVGGLAGGFDRTDKQIGIPRPDATEKEAKALIESANEDWQVSAHILALKIWALLQPLWELEEAHRAWLKKDEVINEPRYAIAQLLPEGAAEDVLSDWEAMQESLEPFVESMNRLRAAVERARTGRT